MDPTASALSHVPQNISRRDWFAGLALIGLLTSTGNDTQSIALYQTAIETGESYEAVVARRAFDCADAMMAEAASKE